jgi:hypothetical protein
MGYNMIFPVLAGRRLGGDEEEVKKERDVNTSCVIIFEEGIRKPTI